VAETHTDREGKFELALHGSGDYVLFVSRVGFADQWISISDPKQESVDRTVQLQAEDCDAPDVICDIFSSTPLAREQHPVISRARLLVAPGKAINLLAGAVSTMRSTTAEIGISRSATGLFLIPLNQASLLSSCRNADGPRLSSIRIDGFGPRSEICVRSRDGQLAKIFITREITSLDQQVPVYVVTRTN